jgi:tetratricopeptide (TPR) repeat protein
LVFCTLNQWEEAIRLNKKAIEISPCSIEPYLNLALIYKKKGLLDKAEWYLKKGLDYVPDSHATLDMLAGISYEQGKFPEAEYYLKQAYGVKPGDPDTHYSRGRIGQEKGDHSFPEAGKAPPPSQSKAMESPIHKSQSRGNL